MSGAEVLGIVSAVISIVDATIKLYNAAKDEAGLPPNFKAVATKLPLISKLLEDAETYIENRMDVDLTPSFVPVLTDCSEKSTQLQQLFEQVVPAESDSRLQRYVKAARTIGKGGRVETLIKAILENLQLLTTEFPQAVSRRGQEKLTVAIDEVSKMEPSLPDGFEDIPSFAHYGSGAQNVNYGVGSQYNNNSTGNQNIGSGNQYIGTNHIGFSSVAAPLGDHNFTFRADMINGSVNVYASQLAPQYQSEEHKACLRNLFVTDPLDDMKALKRKKGDRVAGTCEWIFGTECLTAWLQLSHDQDSVSHPSQILWLHGNPGTGKSTLAIYLTDALSMRFSLAVKETLVYFFCDSAFDTRRTATSVIRTLLWQLVKQHPELLDYILPKYNERKRKLFESFDALWELFMAAATDNNTGQKYCIIDALDECDIDSQRILLQQLRETFHNTATAPNIRILVTSRPYWEICKYLDSFTHRDLASFPRVQEDIDRCIKERVAQLKYTEKVKEQVFNILRDKSEGTFLWVGIVCNELERTPSKDAVAYLKRLPSSLHSLYDKLLDAALENEGDKSTIRLILSFVAVSRRPLNVLELSEACQVCLDEEDLETRTQFVREYIDSCRLLVIIQDESVLLLHHSVKEYLTNAAEKAIFSEFEAHAKLAYGCLGYLIRQFHSTKQINGHFSEYSTREWPNHARMAQSRFTIKPTQAIFFDINSPCRETWLSMCRGLDVSEQSYHNRPPQKFSILHVAAHFGVPAIAEHVYHSNSQSDFKALTSMTDDEKHATPLEHAAGRGHSDVVRILLGPGSVMTRYAILAAAANPKNGKEVMSVLLDQRGDDITITQEVIEAVAKNKLNGKEVLQLLLERRGHMHPERIAANVARVGDRKLMALCLEQLGDKLVATEEVVKATAENLLKNTEIMAVLLEQRGFEITITEEVLKAAARNVMSGRELIAFLLKQRGFEITITEEVLKAAAGNVMRGSELIAFLLEKRGFEITITEEVLKAAAGNLISGRKTIALLLEKRGFEITITEGIVKAAAENTFSGNEVMALLLKQRGSEITITKEIVKAAAGNPGSGSEVIALLLKQRGSEITITEEVVKAAAGNSKKEVMALLLEQRGSEIIITEEVVKAAAANNQEQVMAHLLKQRRSKSTITKRC
ncbi:hypothetical protein PWT90_08994 [Aphanocladium album]|nr:hypothetical protein PWT90_08994 [Aphanocladium album]